MSTASMRPAFGSSSHSRLGSASLRSSRRMAPQRTNANLRVLLRGRVSCCRCHKYKFIATHCHAIYSSHHLSMQHFNLVSFSSCRDTCPPHSLLVVCSSLLISLYCSCCHSLSSVHFFPFFPFSSNGFNAPVVRLHRAFARWIAPERCCCSTCTVLLSSCPPHRHCLMHPHCQSVSNH